MGHTFRKDPIIAAPRAIIHKPEFPDRNTVDKQLQLCTDSLQIQWAGFLLWNALKIRYESKAIPQEIFLAKMKCLNLKCHGNAKGYIQECQENRKKFFVIADLDKTKSDIFDNDLIQSVLLNLPQAFQAFTSIYRTNPILDFDVVAEANVKTTTASRYSKFLPAQGKICGGKEKEETKRS